MLAAGIDHLLRPDAGLYLTDVRAVQQKHAETRLTDTTTDGVPKSFEISVSDSGR